MSKKPSLKGIKELQERYKKDRNPNFSDTVIADIEKSSRIYEEVKRQEEKTEKPGKVASEQELDP